MERGRTSIPAIIAMVLLVAFGVAVITAAENTGSNSYDKAVAKARCLARQGIMEKGLAYLRSLKPSQLPDHRVDLPSGESADGERYQGVYVVPEPNGMGNHGGPPTSYIIGATGVAEFVDESGGTQEVSQTESTRSFRVSFASFIHLTDSEHTVFGELIPLIYPADTIYGDVHSNDYIRLFGGTIFAGHVRTSAPNFVIDPPGSQPRFLNFPPEFNAPRIVFPSQAIEARRCAHAEGLFFDGEGIYCYRAIFDVQYGIRVYRDLIGVPPTDTLVYESPILIDAAMFFDAPLGIQGTVFGNLTIAASGDVRLLDNIMYIDSHPNGEVIPESQNVLGIISENDIVIANTPENGRGNSAQGQDIIINAALLALKSFTFEDQNDVTEIYQGPMPDERGMIHLWGSVAQKQRGYLHRSNHAGSGYGKDYHYDERFRLMPPPCFETVIGEMGYSQFNIESWGAD